MPSWKKIIVSGSNASLNQISASGGFKGDGSAITNVSFDNISSKPTLFSGSGQFATDVSGSWQGYITGSGIVSSSVASSPSQGTIRIATNGVNTDVDSGLQTADSPTFAGLTSTGNVVVQGTLTAETYVVSSSITTMSIAQSSGSTIFGDTPADDTHQFTGSLTVTSSALTIDSSGTVSGSSTSTGSFGVIEVGGGHFTSASLAAGGSGGVSSYTDLTNVPVGIVSGSSQIATSISGSFTSTSASLVTITDSLETASGSFSTRVTTIEGSGTTQGVGQSDNVTFNSITTTGPDTFGGNVTIAGNLNLQGSQSAAQTLVIADQFGFFASGSESANVDAGVLVQSGSSAMTGSALYNDIAVDANKNPNGGRWSVAKNVKADDVGVTPAAYVGTVTVGGDTTEPDSDDVKYGVGEMYITSDGEIFIYTGS